MSEKALPNDELDPIRITDERELSLALMMAWQMTREHVHPLECPLIKTPDLWM